jgi:hypothetical protein
VLWQGLIGGYGARYLTLPGNYGGIEPRAQHRVDGPRVIDVRDNLQVTG